VSRKLSRLSSRERACWEVRWMKAEKREGWSLTNYGERLKTEHESLVGLRELRLFLNKL